MAILEGVLAIHKPHSISSFDVIRTITPLFRESPIFQPLIERNRSRIFSEPSARRAKDRRKDKLNELKIGHGGTLDPLATGVLIVGVGSGTKSLQGFLDGTKEYECTVLFGAATDSYDIVGKVTKTAPWTHITKEKVEAALDTLRGKQMQLPPVYSSIRVDGKHLYEYARAGLPLPEIKRRSVTVFELEMIEWLPPDKHEFEIPSQEADDEAKLLTERITWPKSLLNKRKRDGEESGSEGSQPQQKIKRASPPTAENTETVHAAENVPKVNEERDVKVEEGDVLKDESEVINQDRPTETKPSPTSSRPPAARLRMKVSSGFYVRSLCHDLGLAVSSAGLMATLVRHRQSNFELGKNVIEYSAFEQGADVWEPQVQQALEDWKEKHPNAQDRNGPREGPRHNNGGREDGRRGGRKGARRENDMNDRRRNSSSPEPQKERRRNSSSPEPKRETRGRRNSSSVEPERGARREPSGEDLGWG